MKEDKRLEKAIATASKQLYYAKKAIAEYYESKYLTAGFKLNVYIQEDCSLSACLVPVGGGRCIKKY